jgi:hypothetical protein
MFPVLLLQLVAALVIVGLILWALTQIPMDPTIAKIIRVLVIVCVGIWLVYVLLGMAGSGPILGRGLR